MDAVQYARNHEFAAVCTSKMVHFNNTYHCVTILRIIHKATNAPPDSPMSLLNGPFHRPSDDVQRQVGDLQGHARIRADVIAWVCKKAFQLKSLPARCPEKHSSSVLIKAPRKIQEPLSKIHGDYNCLKIQGDYFLIQIQQAYCRSAPRLDQPPRD